MSELNLLDWTLEEVYMLEHTLASQPFGESRFADTLSFLSVIIMTQAVRTGETLELHPECHTVIPSQRLPIHDRDRTWEDFGRAAI